MAAHVDKELALQALLAEYETLREEIQNRSELQNRFLQLHVTAITIVVGLLLQNEFHIYFGFVVMIAVSSSVFGLWWIDQALTINRIGRHLGDPIEDNVNALVGASVMQWESEDRNPILREFSETLMFKGFEGLALLTYIIPALVAFGTATFYVGRDIWGSIPLFAVIVFLLLLLVALIFWWLWMSRQMRRFRNLSAVFYLIAASYIEYNLWDNSDSNSRFTGIVVALLLFVAVIFSRLLMARQMMSRFAKHSDCYKRHLRNEPLSNECHEIIENLEGRDEWMCRQERIHRIFGG